MNEPLIYSNVTRHENMRWQDYVKLPGYSFSYLKRASSGGTASYFTPTDKMRLGTISDAILMQQDEVDMKDPLFPHARNIASALMSTWGAQIKSFQCQVSYSGTVTCGEFGMEVKGRTDWELKNHAIIDLKITEATNLPELVKFMGYDNQQNNYCGLAALPTAYILAYNHKLKRCLPLLRLPYDPHSQWWKDKIIREYGTIC